MNIEVNGTNYVVREVTIKELTTDLVDHIRKERLAEANEIGKYLEGKEKTDYMIRVWKESPSTNEILGQLDEYIQSLNGITWLAERCIEPKLEIEIETIEQYTPLFQAIVGVKPGDIKEQEGIEKN